MKRNILIYLILIFIPTLSAAASQSLETEDFFALSLDELMNARVITAGRSLQKISEAPAAMSIVTEEDIRQLGATTLAEALSMVVGLHLGHTNASFPLAGGIRGFHKLPANKIMLLIDGISYSYEMYGVPTFFQIPISLKEIDRIEVLRGPGSSLYGANAMFGVVNVITKKSADTHGTLTAATAGEDDLFMTTLMHGGSLKDNINYRMTFEWEQRDNRDYIAWASNPEQRNWKINSTLDCQINTNSDVSLFAGYSGLDKQDVIVESTGPVDQSGADTVQAVVAYSVKDPNIKVKAHFKQSEKGQGTSFGVKYLDFDMGTKGVEFQHELKPFENDTLVWGANIDQTFSDGDSIGGKHTHDMPGVFLENSHRFNPIVSLNTGIRLDDHPLTDTTVSHRVSLLFMPHAIHIFRLTWGNSYRNPDFIESYYSRISPIDENTYIHVYGQDNLDPEKATTYEIGYIGEVSQHCVLSANLFYTELDDFIYFIPFGDPYFDEDLGGFVVPFPFRNIGDAEQYGAELEITCQITDWLTGTVNYTYIDQKEKDPQIEQLLEMTPRHMANGQVRAKFRNGFSANATVHYKDVCEWREYIWQSPYGNTIAGGRANSHIYADLRAGYEFRIGQSMAELSASAFNVFDTEFDEYPLDTSDVARRVSVSLSVRF